MPTGDVELAAEPEPRGRRRVTVAVEAEVEVSGDLSGEDVADLLFEALAERPDVDLEFACSTVED